MARPELADIQLCVCGCGGVSIGKGLTKAGHVPFCGTQRSGAERPCPACQGRRNRAKGLRAQAKTHRALGGQGFTPSNEESARPYEVTVVILPESKTGEQVPASFEKFTSSAFFRRALSQSTRAIPVGSGALPAVAIAAQFVIVDIRNRSKSGGPR